MGVLGIIIYIVGALVTHYIIYIGNREEDIEAETANIASILWPVAVMVCLVLEVEDLYEKVSEWYRNR